MGYPRKPYVMGTGQGVLHTDRPDPKPVEVGPPLPGNVIMVHGVNDVGVSYEQAEQGLCKGLKDRLGWKRSIYQPATYRMPKEDDKGKLLVDPDDVFFKRKLDESTYSPVIPFYWGYREANGHYKSGSATSHGQAVDRYGNRLDKDYSKGGGPFANATSTLPDMWSSGAPRAWGAPDALTRDPLRPVLGAPGRMYMVLAAKRLAALVAMIRSYDPQDHVSLVAHSQGCMVSLLAQAFLLQDGERPADTLVLTHPPYSLEISRLDGIGKSLSSQDWFNDLAKLDGGTDDAMKKNYPHIEGRQTLHARLQTLVNIVKGVHERRGMSEWLPDPKAAKACGLVGTGWEKPRDRDNRGKVYLYFCPEDMTVALNNVQGIGWQGVPDVVVGHKVNPDKVIARRGEASGELNLHATQQHRREPLKELGAGFLQRVFTGKKRLNPQTRQMEFVKVGIGPHDFALKMKGEDDHAHAMPDLKSQRADLPDGPSGNPRGLPFLPEDAKRDGLRTITGEKLNEPHKAEMDAGSIKGSGGKLEDVDPIDASIAPTSDYGMQVLPPVTMDDPRDASWHRKNAIGTLGSDGIKALERALNKDKPQEDCCEVKEAWWATQGKIIVTRKETPNEARLRLQQRGVSSRSFHGAIFGSASNHQHVTAYDVSIGQGKASSDPWFYNYLCAVADWRLKKPKGSDSIRPSILLWDNFLKKQKDYWAEEKEERKILIEGNCDYYSTGMLPKLPIFPEDMPSALVCETIDGMRAVPKPLEVPKKSSVGHVGAMQGMHQQAFSDVRSSRSGETV